MSRKIKHSFEFKLSVVKLVMKGDRCVSSISEDNHIDRSMVQLWVRFYERYGEAGLLPQSNKYSLETKLAAIRSLTDKRLTLGKACLEFGIRSGSVLSKWVQIYESQGIDGLATETRGIRKPMASKHTNKKQQRPSSDQERLREENKRLLAENAYLKKLHALIRREEAEKGKKH